MVPIPETGSLLPVQVLLVEDEILIRKLVAEELIEVGFQVIEAGSALEALAYIEAGGKVDVVLTDIHMPGELNGLDVARYFRLSHPEIPVIVSSGNPGPTIGDFDFLPKPYTPLQAVGIIVRLINAKR
jgi:CheY-like chemotaxis protein